MPQNHAAFTGDFLLSTRTIVLAGQDLQDALAQNEPTAIEFAITELEQAYARYDQAGENYRTFMLGRLGTTRSAAQAERVSIDAMASVVTDLQVSHVLLAAGAAVGEVKLPPRRGRKAVVAPLSLTDALQALEQTTRVLRRPLAAPLSRPPSTGTRGLFGPAQPIVIEAVHSASLEEALQTFNSTASDTLERLIEGVYKAIMACIEAISKLDEESILAALRMLGLELEKLPDIGRLIRLGIDRLKKAIAALVAWLGEEIMDLLKAKLEELLRRWLSGEKIESELRRVLNVEATQNLVREASARPGLTREELDQASTALKVLTARFDEHMGTITQAARTVTLIGGLLATSGLGVKAVLLSAVAYLAVIAWAVGMGMDYADSGRILNRVAGVGVIAQGLLQ